MCYNQFFYHDFAPHKFFQLLKQNINIFMNMRFYYQQNFSFKLMLCQSSPMISSLHKTEQISSNSKYQMRFYLESN